MNEVEYCTGCAISMIITCKIDYSKIFFCNIQSSLSFFFFLFFLFRFYRYLFLSHPFFLF